MNEIQLEIPGVKVFTPDVLGDERGFFFESFRSSWLPDLDFVQDNHSRSAKGTLRGLHYQLEHPQGKLVRVISGCVYDVAVDIRRSSPHFGNWIARVLSADNREIFWVPPGFAHGFLVLSDEAEFVYKCTDYYAPGDEYGVRWDDPDLAISWPDELLPPTLSTKDQQAPQLKDARVYD
ncbi:MAG: dTDP-4-dehydrorhamnose 3,5-epimerase [Gammaproteobacteria bacterium]|jgi:dTDP-4-dehydrorhamnose 3,5-epimerase|nr:dTDP-4-dehydrorhamnose 3,5-epimerase [Gammaproteobacteria bacterium]MBT4493754.1 dTDP-4-dehydrorhamnose 3,5-epimerase [Gammaproteobacteria bacterium]MBT7371482.1 dTDP-4-dehydrorhamnose 3,5-epimerase [Gammaproteobacteria bacterium]